MRGLALDESREDQSQRDSQSPWESVQLRRYQVSCRPKADQTLTAASGPNASCLGLDRRHYLQLLTSPFESDAVPGVG